MPLLPLLVILGAVFLWAKTPTGEPGPPRGFTWPPVTSSRMTAIGDLPPDQASLHAYPVVSQ